MYLVPALYCRDPVKGNAKVLEFAQEGVDDLPPGQSLQTLAAELEEWQLLLQELSLDELPSTTLQALRFAADKLCPRITRSLELVCSLPVSTASCERCISGPRCCGATFVKLVDVARQHNMVTIFSSSAQGRLCPCPSLFSYVLALTSVHGNLKDEQQCLNQIQSRLSA